MLSVTGADCAMETPVSAGIVVVSNAIFVIACQTLGVLFLTVTEARPINQLSIIFDLLQH
jgi:hypothetical protein